MSKNVENKCNQVSKEDEKMIKMMDFKAIIKDKEMIIKVPMLVEGLILTMYEGDCLQFLVDGKWDPRYVFVDHLVFCYYEGWNLNSDLNTIAKLKTFCSMIGMNFKAITLRPGKKNYETMLFYNKERNSVGGNTLNSLGFKAGISVSNEKLTWRNEKLEKKIKRELIEKRDKLINELKQDEKMIEEIKNKNNSINKNDFWQTFKINRPLEWNEITEMENIKNNKMKNINLTNEVIKERKINQNEKTRHVGINKKNDNGKNRLHLLFIRSFDKRTLNKVVFVKEMKFKQELAAFKFKIIGCTTNDRSHPNLSYYIKESPPEGKLKSIMGYSKKEGENKIVEENELEVFQYHLMLIRSFDKKSLMKVMVKKKTTFKQELIEYKFNEIYCPTNDRSNPKLNMYLEDSYKPIFSEIIRNIVGYRIKRRNRKIYYEKLSESFKVKARENLKQWTLECLNYKFEEIDTNPGLITKRKNIKKIQKQLIEDHEMFIVKRKLRQNDVLNNKKPQKVILNDQVPFSIRVKKRICYFKKLIKNIKNIKLKESFMDSVKVINEFYGFGLSYLMLKTRLHLALEAQLFTGNEYGFI